MYLCARVQEGIIPNYVRAVECSNAKKKQVNVGNIIVFNKLEFLFNRFIFVVFLKTHTVL